MQTCGGGCHLKADTPSNPFSTLEKNNAGNTTSQSNFETRRARIVQYRSGNINWKMALRRKEEYIPIKCEGWNGKFQYTDGAMNNVSKIRRQNQNVTNTNNFYGFSTEPTVLPTEWDGTFVKSGETRIKPERNRSDDQDYYDFDTEATVLPPTWSGEFVTDPNDIRIKPERNFSDARDYAEASRFKLVKQ